LLVSNHRVRKKSTSQLQLTCSSNIDDCMDSFIKFAHFSKNVLQATKQLQSFDENNFNDSMKMKCTQRRNFKRRVMNFYKYIQRNLKPKSNNVTNQAFFAKNDFYGAVANCFIGTSS